MGGGGHYLFFLVNELYSHISFVSAIALVFQPKVLSVYRYLHKNVFFLHDLYSKLKCEVNSDIKVYTMQ